MSAAIAEVALLFATLEPDGSVDAEIRVELSSGEVGSFHARLDRGGADESWRPSLGAPQGWLSPEGRDWLALHRVTAVELHNAIARMRWGALPGIAVELTEAERLVLMMLLHNAPASPEVDRLKKKLSREGK